MNTTENNKLIDTFNENKYYKLFFSYDEMLYHKNWNWLMEVVEKIESLGYWVNQKRNFCIIEVFGNDYEAKDVNTFFVNKKQWVGTKIEAVYNACVEFIKWYNNQN